MSCACPTCGAALVDDGTVRVDFETGIIVACGYAAYLTKAEFAMFDALWSAKPRMLTKEQLLEATAGIGFDDRELKLVDVFVCKIRKHLKPLKIKIDTCWGKGYRIIGGFNHA